MSKLAIHGGKPSILKGHVAWPIVTDKEKKAVMAVLDRRVFWGAFAPEVKELQKEWARYLGMPYCLATNSGTAALHIALRGVGVGSGDEVITTALTFVATALAALHCSAVPIFVDVDPRTFNIDPAKIEEKITSRTRAIMPVHLHGLPADMDRINAIAKKHGLSVIEDACQAHGAVYKGKKAGTLGDAAGFSLNGSKNLPGCEGGLFVTNSETARNEAAKVRDLGEIIEEGVERDYNAFEIGWMYRSTEMNAAFARVRLQSLDKENAQRRKNAAHLNEKLQAFKGIIPPYLPADCESAFYMNRLRFDPKALGLEVPPKEFRAKVQKALRAEGVQANRWQNRPVPMQQLFQQKRGYGQGTPWRSPAGGESTVVYRAEDFPETQKVVDDSIVISDAIFPPNGTDLMDRYVQTFAKLWENLDEVLRVELKPEEIYVRD
jgi:perosamine synthetase